MANRVSEGLLGSSVRSNVELGRKTHRKRVLACRAEAAADGEADNHRQSTMCAARMTKLPVMWAGFQHAQLLERSLAALLTLLMMARPDRSVVKGVRQDLGAQDLAGMRFDGRDLSDLSFCNSDLSNVIFRNCDLRRARFDGAFLSRTRFEGNNSLEDAQFGDFGRI